MSGVTLATNTISATGNITGGNVLVSGVALSTNTISAFGNITGGNILGGANVNATTHTGTTVSVTANVACGNVLTGGLISATGNITGGNILGGANVNATTHTGTTVSVTGNVNGGNIISAGVISATGNAAGLGTQILTLTDSSTVAGSGKAFAIQSGTNNLAVIGNVTNGSYNSLQATGDIALLASGPSVGNVGFSIIPWSGAVSGIKMATSSNVTTITLAGTTVSSTGNVSVTGTVSASGNITGGNLSVTGIAGTLSTAAQTSITSVGTLTSLAVTGNITGGNFVGTLNGSGSNVTSISATNISSGTLAQARLANTSVTLGSTALTLGATVTTVAGLTSVTSTTFVGALTGAATTAGTVTTAAQGNITSVGTLTGLTINNATTAITNGAASGSGNIGASGATFNTVFAKATTAQYADLAEMYTSDAEYEPGTVIDFGGEHEVTISTTANSDKIAGVVSTNPAHLMNSTQSGEHVLAVALTGRVPTRVTGTIWKGAMMVSAGNGQATASATPAIGTVLGKSLEDFSGESGVIQVVVGRL